MLPTLDILHVGHLLAGLAIILSVAAGAAYIRNRPNLVGWNERMGLLVAAFALLLGIAEMIFGATSLGLSLPPWVSPVLWTAIAVLAPLAALAATWLFHDLVGIPTRAELNHRIAAHRRTLEKLRLARAEQEQRVIERSREVYEVSKRLDIALRDSSICVFTQDRNLRYTWIRNAPAGFSSAEMIGRTDAELFPPATARALSALKQRVLATGEDGRMEFESRRDGMLRTFDLLVEPYREQQGGLSGILCVSVEVTERKIREEQLRHALREVVHRSKNVLAMLLAIAHRSARGRPDTREFLDVFEARLRSLVAVQDLLVEADWAPVPLADLVRSQIRPHAGAAAARVRLDGPPVCIKPEPAQNLGVALHELADNARRHGALSCAEGWVEASWHWIRTPEQEFAFNEGVTSRPDGQTQRSKGNGKGNRQDRAAKPALRTNRDPGEAEPQAVASGPSPGVDETKTALGGPMAADDGTGKLVFRWREHGGPAAAASDHEGFGSIVLNRLTARALDGRSDCRFEPGGFVCELEISGHHLTRYAPR